MVRGAVRKWTGRRAGVIAGGRRDARAGSTLQAVKPMTAPCAAGGQLQGPGAMARARDRDQQGGAGADVGGEPGDDGPQRQLVRSCRSAPARTVGARCGVRRLGHRLRQPGHPVDLEADVIAEGIAGVEVARRCGRHRSLPGRSPAPAGRRSDRPATWRRRWPARAGRWSRRMDWAVAFCPSISVTMLSIEHLLLSAHSPDCERGCRLSGSTWSGSCAC